MSQRQRLIAWIFGLYGLLATATGLWLTYLAIFHTGPKGSGRSGDVVGPPDWMMQVFFATILGLLALMLLAIAALNITGCAVYLRRGKTAFLTAACMFDALTLIPIALYGISRVGDDRNAFLPRFGPLALAALVMAHLVASRLWLQPASRPEARA